MKYNYPVLKGGIGLGVFSLIHKMCNEHEMLPIQRNIKENHVHVLISAPTYLFPARMAQYLERKSFFCLMREFPELKKRMNPILLRYGMSKAPQIKACLDGGHS